MLEPCCVINSISLQMYMYCSVQYKGGESAAVDQLLAGHGNHSYCLLKRSGNKLHHAKAGLTSLFRNGNLEMWFSCGFPATEVFRMEIIVDPVHSNEHTYTEY